MARSIEVTAPGLELYAANCAQHSAAVISTAAVPPSVPANPAQATALAVGTIHTAVAAHGATLGERIATTAGAAFSSAAIYTETEVSNRVKVTVDSIMDAID
ncbi:MAG TPA: hypothetical protein VH496_07215 [Mycobacterium sp.]